MPKSGKSKSKESVRGGGSGGNHCKQASSKGGSLSGVSSRYRNGSTTGSDRVGDGAVPVEAVTRRLHKLEDLGVADVLLEVIPGVGALSADLSSYSLAENTSVKESPPHPPHSSEGIGVLSTSSTANANVLITPEAARECVTGDRTLSWDSTADVGPHIPGPLLLPLGEFGCSRIERPNSVCSKVERLTALVAWLSRKNERVTQDELDCSPGRQESGER